MKTLMVFLQNIKFCKAQSMMNFRNILYLSHILGGAFPQFWLPNLGEYLKIQKSQLTHNTLYMNQLANFILFNECPT